MLVKYFSIKSESGSFSAFDAIDSDEVVDFADLLSGAVGDVYEFGIDHPEWMEDIRGNIHNEPDRVFVELTQHDDETHANYFGIICVG